MNRAFATTEEMESRLLGEADFRSLDLFLEPYIEQAYYIRSNLERGGILYNSLPYQSDYYGVFHNRTLQAVLSHNWIGSIQVISAHEIFIDRLAQAWIERLAKFPRKVDCFLGPAGNVERLLHSLNLEDKDLRGGPRIEGLFSLDIEDIIAPEFILETSMNVRHSQICDMETLVKWRHDFYVESQGAKPGEESFSRAYEEISRRLEGGELFVLEKNNELLSFCGLGGFLADCKIIGPVWTPHSLRGRGYGRTVTAGALLHARDMGCKKAILFTLNPQAERAYRAIGFERIGDWRVDFPVDFNAEKIKESLVLRRKENEATN